ncbi:hypothetical protein OPIT5_30845 [Opitutaceae bacterium TAV5]|nr:hypothetical protein OPIT5_30845 [Opitutaceae bacterium TAV5]
MQLEILESARDDLSTGFEFYARKEPWLGPYFLETVFSAIESLKLHAGAHRKVYGYHRALTDRFPYAIYYSYEPPRVRIRAVVDCRRDPSWISAHLRG